jgi:aryl-alcohol dehydrogenase-like predicted oxidoreductase
MEYRQLGQSGLRVSVLTLGTMTFGGRGNFTAVGQTDVEGARRQVDTCLDAGVNLIDTADSYSGGLSEEIVGEVLRGRRDSVLLSTKVRMAVGEGPNDAGLSRHHIISGCEASLRRLGTDHIDIYHVHEWDGQTRMEETLSALDSLVTSGKVRYLAASNYAGWQLMKALALADAHGYERFSAQQIYYSLESRDAEYELVPLAIVAWRVPCAGRAGLAPRAARGDLADHRGAHRRAARRQPGRGVTRARRRRAGGTGQGQRAGAHIPALAPGEHRTGPARRRGPGPAQPAPGLGLNVRPS